MRSLRRAPGHWWRPRRGAAAYALAPLAWIYGAVIAARRWAYRAGLKRSARAPVPVIVVGNLVAGGAGKTPTVIALVQFLAREGWHPGVIARGYGSVGEGAREVRAGGDPLAQGDEPTLIARRTGVPTWVAQRRIDAARALCEAHREVDVIVADDGLQHLALARDFELIVFDERGAGNGALIPAGPLREPLPARVGERARVVYNATRPSTALPGPCVARRLGDATPLAAWRDGKAGGSLPLAALRGRRLLAVAGIAAPERFFAMLRDAGLSIDELPLPDHHGYACLPWGADVPEVIVTEKDAIKLRALPLGGTIVWVVALDFELPRALTDAVLDTLARRRL